MSAGRQEWQPFGVFHASSCVTAGIDFAHDDYSVDNYGDHSTAQPRVRNFSTMQVGAFAQARVEFQNGFDLSTGLRYDHHRAGLAGDIGQNEGDHACAAFDVTPHARLAFHPPAAVVEGNRGGAGIERAGVRTDHPLTEQGNVQPLVVKKMFYIIGHRPFKQKFVGFFITVEAILYLGADGGGVEP